MMRCRLYRVTLARTWLLTMFEMSCHFQVPIQSIGPIARQVIQQQSFGKIFSIFQRTFYLKSNSNLLCIGTNDLYNGPLNLITSAPAATTWSDCGIRIGQNVALGSSRLTLESGLEFTYGDACYWSPPKYHTPKHIVLGEGLSRLCLAAEKRIPSEGLGCFINSNICPDLLKPVAVQAVQPLTEIRVALLKSFRLGQWVSMPVAARRSLIGLGPGLTPSGDDFLCGMMIGLNLLGFEAFAAELREGLEAVLPADPSQISLAHFEAASLGLGAAGLHSVAKVLFVGEKIKDDLLDGVDQIGHTSGWDALAGMVFVFKAWVLTRGNTLINGEC